MKMKINAKMVEEAYGRIKEVVKKTPLQFNDGLSKRFMARIYLKREDLQAVRSYKIRGAYNKISTLSSEEKNSGIVCASAGNHAQGVAFGCNQLKIKGHIFMPQNAPKQKVERVHNFGGKWVEVVLVGDTFDESNKKAQEFKKKHNKVFIHPFDDALVIAGQGTVGKEILEQSEERPDYVIVPIGGGGLISGLSIYIKEKDSKIGIIGVESEGVPSMHRSLEEDRIIELDKIDKFVDGTAVKRVGKLGFEISRKFVDKVFLVPEGKVCQEMINLYQNDGIVAEPAGALAVSVLDQLKEKIKGKMVVCVVSGGNNDISRYPEIVERSLAYQGLKHYFIIDFPQRAGALRKFLDKVLGPKDDIVLFEYLKRSNKESGPALVGLELAKKEDLSPLIKRMDRSGFKYQIIDRESSLFDVVL